MPVEIRHKINIKIDPLRHGGAILNEEFFKAGTKAGQYLQGKVRVKQRINTGQERRRTLYRVTNRRGTTSVSVYNTIVQALVDETGANWRGTMPPSHPGSKLFAWVERKGLAAGTLDPSDRRSIGSYYRGAARRAGATRAEAIRAGRENVAAAVADQDKRVARVAFLIARAIARRGLPRPGDPLRKPFEVTRKEEAPKVRLIFDIAAGIAARRMS